MKIIIIIWQCYLQYAKYTLSSIIMTYKFFGNPMWIQLLCNVREEVTHDLISVQSLMALKEWHIWQAKNIVVTCGEFHQITTVLSQVGEICMFRAFYGSTQSTQSIERTMQSRNSEKARQYNIECANIWCAFCRQDSGSFAGPRLPCEANPEPVTYA